jgi:hypothetical protein
MGLVKLVLGRIGESGGGEGGGAQEGRERGGGVCGLHHALSLFVNGETAATGRTLIHREGRPLFATRQA